MKAVMSGRGQLGLRFAAAATILGRKAPHRAAGSGRSNIPGSTIFLDGSSTVFQMTRMLRDQQNLTVITNGLYAALELSFAPEVTTIVVGGILRRRTAFNLVDMLSPDMLRRLHIDVAFLSCRGFTFANGMMESDLREAQLRPPVAMAAQRTVALIDTSKFGQPYTASSLLPEEVDELITGDELAPDARAKLQELGIEMEYV
ncbi:MAG: hypothetical protein R2851_06645 [Caldilineaceae bacterium]